MRPRGMVNQHHRMVQREWEVVANQVAEFDALGEILAAEVGLH